KRVVINAARDVRQSPGCAMLVRLACVTMRLMRVIACTQMRMVTLRRLGDGRIPSSLRHAEEIDAEPSNDSRKHGSQRAKYGDDRIHQRVAQADGIEPRLRRSDEKSSRRSRRRTLLAQA